MDKNLTEGKDVQIKYARLIIPYDNESEEKAVKNWLKKVGETELPGGGHLVPEITFGKCTPVIEGEQNHSESCLKAEQRHNFPEIYYHDILHTMKALIRGNIEKHIPPVRIWGAWNEPELSSLKAGQAAEVWGAAVRALHKAGCHVYCKVIAGEFAGYRKFPGRNELSYVTGYEKAIIEDARRKKWDAGKPEVWGLHDYKDLKEAAETATEVSKKLVRKNGTGSAEAQAFVQGTHRAGLGHPQDWITENGVQLWVRSGHTSLYGNPEGQRIAAEDFLELGKQSTGHIETNNYYEYKTTVTNKKQEEKEEAHNDSNQFDSALLSDEGKMPEDERPAYCVIALADKGVCPPTSTTQAAVTASITSTAATVSLTVNPAGGPTKYRVEYGTTTAYGHTTTLTAAANSIGEQSEAVAISGLEACTTYHYQAEAENEADESKPALGGDKIFTTSCPSATSVSAGGYLTCAALAGGSGACWGDNRYGGLGYDPSTGPEECASEFEISRLPCSHLPLPVSGISGAVAVSAGGWFACALLSGGKIDCWGNNEYGQLGNGTTESSSTPVPVSGITNAIAISASNAYACALLSGGKVDCWGYNEENGTVGGGGELGNGTTKNSSTPVAVSGITNATAIDTGTGSACALLGNEEIDCWGDNEHGELGDGTTKNSSTPVTVSGITNATAVSVGENAACALRATGTIDCWGDGINGVLGDGTTENSDTPVAVSGITNAIAISAGSDTSCALLSGESVDCWGDNEFGELGNGTTKNSSTTPVTVSDINDAVAVSSGTGAECALLSGGSLDCWGWNAFGQLGNGTTENTSTPVPVSGIG